MKKMDKKVLIIIPAYNEEECIYDVVSNISKVASFADILVVNDGSSDNTYNELLRLEVNFLNLPINLGIGGAVQAGYIYAYNNNYDFAFQLDGDGQHNPKYIKEMLDILIKKGADMVIGSRFVEKTSYNQTFLRSIGNKFISFIIKLF